MSFALILAASVAGQCSGGHCGPGIGRAYGYAAPAYGYAAPAYGYAAPTYYYAPGWSYNPQPAYANSYWPYATATHSPLAYYPVYPATWPVRHQPTLPSPQSPRGSP